MKANILLYSVLLTSAVSATVTSQLDIKHRESQGVGYNQGYSSIDYFLSAQGTTTQVLFDLRGHVFNDGRPAGNVGAGWRYGLDGDSSRIGTQLFYDFRSYSHFFAQQIGAGLEWLGQQVDVRLNGYLPIGQKESFHSHRFHQFAGNTLMVRRKFSAALPCLEGEVGTCAGKPFYFAVGTYYLFQESRHGLRTGKAWGAKARFDVDVSRYCTLSAYATYDHIFHVRVQGILTLHIPLGPERKPAKGKPVRRDLELIPIVRNEIIPIQTRKRSRAPLTASGDDPVSFIFVNNLARSGGDGTYEKPFSSLKAAEKNSKPGDQIYIFPGDGTARNMDEGIVLKRDQQLISAGAPHLIDTVVIPSLAPGQRPILTNIHHDKPIVSNPGKTTMSNFYFMNPWDYLSKYERQTHVTESFSFYTLPPPAKSHWDDPLLKTWVDLNK